MKTKDDTLENQSKEYQLLYETNLKLCDLIDLLELLLQGLYEDEYVGMLHALQLNLSAILDPIQKEIYK